MSEPLTFVMLKPRKVGHGTRQPGELVPEAANWSNRNAYITRGVIAPVPVTGLSDEHKQFYDTWVQEQERIRQEQEREQERNSGGGETPSPQSPPPDPAAQKSGEPSFADQVADTYVDEIKEKVESGEWSAEEVWEAEEAGKKRSTLTDWLEEKIEGSS